jgi:type II secretory pathway predicted ATPase ExeA
MRRFVRVNAPLDGVSLIGMLAVGLGARLPREFDRCAAWRAFSDALKICRWQSIHAVVLIDDAHVLVEERDRRDLQRLEHFESDPTTQLTVLETFLESTGESSARWDGQPDPLGSVANRLHALTRSETDRYVAEKLAAATRVERTFTTRAVSRLYEATRGVPRGIDRLGTLSLMAGAVRRLAVITPDVIDYARSECDSIRSPNAA